ncbi:uncharacterized protein CMC5_007980 [Chondromyces crocatus]|uniref:Tetratricopeptide repeat protein n=2 Tax=Chondromyces crocatus TaxID=52 RepID=A0A0K1E7Y8_CHOCO|nr:uncharacterized protein CMC5_007980 [Chondromyces crocatus]
MPPPELMHRMAPLSAGEVVLENLRLEAPASRHAGPRAEAAYWRGRLEERRAHGDALGEREAAITLARLLASRGIELETAASLAQRGLALGEDTGLRVELAGWLASLGEPAAAAAALKSVCDVQRPSGGARTLVRIAVLLARAGNASGAVDALIRAASLEPTDAMASELLGTISAWSPELVPPEAAARAYLDAAERREALRERDAAFEDRLRALEIAPQDARAAAVMSAALAARGRVGASDEVARIHAMALSERGEIERALEVHVRRLEAALSDGDAARAAGCALDAELEADLESDDVEVIDEVLGQASLYELVAVRKELRAARLVGTARAAMFEALARLYAGPLASPERSLEAWIEAAVADPSGVYAWAALREHASASQDPLPLMEALIRVADGGGGLPSDPRASIDALRDLAVLAETRMADAGLACWAFERLLRAEVDEEVAAAGLQRLAEQARTQDEALGRAQQLLQEAASAEERSRALRQLVTIYRGRPDDLSAYEEALAALAQELPADGACIMALERLARRTGSGSSLVPLLEASRPRAESDGRGGQVSSGGSKGSKRAELVRTRLLLATLHQREGDESAAIEAVLPLLSEVPGHRGAASAVLVFATQMGRIRERADALVQLAGPVWPALRAVLLALAAELYAAAGEPTLGRKAAELASEADPTSVRAVMTLAHLLASDDLKPRVEGLAAVRSERGAAAAIERAITTVIPRGILCDGLARMLEALGEQGLALGWTQRWLALHPGCGAATGHLIRRAVVARDAARLSDALAWVLAQPRPLDDLAPMLGTSLDALFELDPARATALGKRALDVLGPRMPSLRQRLLEFAERSGDRQLGIAVLERSRAAEPDVVAARELLLLLAERRMEAGDPSGAARELVRAVEQGADPQGVLHHVRRLEAWLQDSTVQLGSDGVVALTEARARALTSAGASADAAVAWRELGGLLWDLADDKLGAEKAFHRACELLPHGGEERYARDLREFAGVDLAIEMLIQRASDSEGRAAPSEIQPSAPQRMPTAQRRRRASLLIEAASMAAEHRLNERALAIAVSAIEIDSSRADAVALVERCAEGEQGVATLHRVYGLLADAAMGCYGRRAAHYRAARQLERRNAITLALSHAASSFEAVPTEGTSYVLLARLAERAEEPTEAVRVIERVAAGAENAGLRTMWLRRAAGLAGASEEGVRTRVDLLLRALNVRPDAATVEDIGQAIGELISITGEVLPESLRFDRAIKATLPRLEGPDGARAAIAMARVAVRVLGASASALAAIERGMRIDGDVEEYESLVDLIPELAREAERAQHLIAAIYAAGKNPHANVGPALLRWASRLADVLKVPDVAAALLVEAARRAPENPELAFEADVFVQLTGDDALQRALDDALPVARRIEALLHLADQHEREGKLDKVILALQRALETGEVGEEIHEQVVGRLWRLLSLTGDSSALEVLLQQEAERDDLPAERLQTVIGELSSLLSARGDLRGALEVIGRKAHRLPLTRELLDEIRRLSTSTGARRLQVDILTRLAGVLETKGLSPVDQEALENAEHEHTASYLSVLRDLAPIERELGDDAVAIAHYHVIARLDPKDTEALEALEEDASRRRDHERIAELLQLRIVATSSLQERRVLQLRRAAVLEQRLGLLTEACLELEQLLSEAPNDAAALRYLGDMYERLGAPLRAAPGWAQLGRLATSQEERADYALRACRAYLKGGEIDAASRSLDEQWEAISEQQLLEVRVEIARLRGDTYELARSLDAFVAFIRQDGGVEPGWHADILVESARATSATGDDVGALGQIREALKLTPGHLSALLEGRRLEYRLCGTGTPREAQAAIDDLQRAADALEPTQVELYAFLLAEHLDVIQGHGAGMRELTRRHAEVGPAALIALGMAERLAQKRNFAAAVPLFERALDGHLQGLRSRGRVALAAAHAAERTGDVSAASRLLEQAYAETDTRSLAARRRLELTAAYGERDVAQSALEELAGQSSGTERAHVLVQLAALLLDVEPQRSASLLAEAADLARDNRMVDARIAELRIKIEAVREQKAKLSEQPIAPTSLPSAGSSERFTAETLPDEGIVSSGSRSGRSRHPKSPVIDLAFDYAELRTPPSPSVSPVATPMSVSVSPTSSVHQENAQPEAVSTSVIQEGGQSDTLLGMASPISAPASLGGRVSSYPVSLNGRFLSVNPPPNASEEEVSLLRDVSSGDYDAGERLMSLFLASGEDRTREGLAVRRMQAALKPGDRDSLERLHAAALADRNVVYANAIQHVLTAFDSTRRGNGSVEVERVLPPPLWAQRDAPELVNALLFRDVNAPVNEVLAFVWDTGLFRRDPGQFGITGLERIQPGPATVLGDVYGMIAERLGGIRTPLFLQRAGTQAGERNSGLNAQVLPLVPPAVLMQGDIREETAELRYLLGLSLAGAMPEHVLVCSLPSAELDLVLAAVKAAFGPLDTSVGSRRDPAVTQLEQNLWQLVPPRVERRLRELCVQPTPIEAEAALWSSGLAMRRAGLYATGDLAIAVQSTVDALGISRDIPLREPGGLAAACAAHPEISDLVLTAIRMEYAEARWQTGPPSRTRRVDSLRPRSRVG